MTNLFVISFSYIKKQGKGSSNIKLVYKKYMPQELNLHYFVVILLFDSSASWGHHFVASTRCTMFFYNHMFLCCPARSGPIFTFMSLIVVNYNIFAYSIQNYIRMKESRHIVISLVSLVYSSDVIRFHHVSHQNEVTCLWSYNSRIQLHMSIYHHLYL
ncbi:hypothetical protein ACJX0J_040791, partial [Zea mays]